MSLLVSQLIPEGVILLQIILKNPTLKALIRASHFHNHLCEYKLSFIPCVIPLRDAISIGCLFRIVKRPEWLDAFVWQNFEPY